MLFNGRELQAGGCHGNLDYFPPLDACPLEIKDSGIVVSGTHLGEGLFLRSTAATIAKGTPLQYLYFFGNFQLRCVVEQVFGQDGIPGLRIDGARMYSLPHTGFPGAFALPKPFSTTLLMIDARCPAAKINDARGTTPARHAHAPNTIPNM